jgi:nitroimidazol reductase NimA-like FMN-containing flavoprotein (pyridoxamine 5'-phosphate oxidase superfamily)
MMGNLTAGEIEKLLHGSIVGHIGCTDGKIPYIVPISYANDGSQIKGITFAIRLTSKTGRFEKAHQLAQSFF